jgi:hypothetical protein
MHPTYLDEKDFPFPVKIVHTMTGHIYVRPINNIKPFSNSQETEIKNILSTLNINAVRNRVLANFTTKEIPSGYGFRIYQ